MFKRIGLLMVFVLAGTLLFSCSDYYVWANKNHKISGYAWSENIGWLSLNCYNGGMQNKCVSADYGIDYDKNTGELFGYAWSEHGGWLCVGKSCQTVGYAKSPDNNLPRAEIDDSGMISGWANWIALGESGWVRFQGEEENSAGNKLLCFNCAELKGRIGEVCGFCFSKNENQGSGLICEDCGSCAYNQCGSCSKCFEYGIGVNYDDNTLHGWSWNQDLGWLDFHPLRSKTEVNPPYLQTIGGDVYSGAGIGSLKQPRSPLGSSNATFMLQSNGDIVHFSSKCESEKNCNSGSGWVTENIGLLVKPSRENSYTGNLGSIDLKGLLAGQYGAVEFISSGADINSLLGGSVYYSKGDLEINRLDLINGNNKDSGAGSVIVKGDLKIKGNITYPGGAASKLRNLASLGFIVLKKADGSGGNVYIDPAVAKIAGNIFSEDTIYTGTNGGNDNPLEVKGLMIAKGFKFQRNFSDMETKAPAEQIIYDGRAVANPPPGFTDLIKGLPVWSK